MYHFLLFGILLLGGIIPAQSQEITAKDIVTSSFQKYGNMPDSYGLKAAFIELQKIPSDKITMPSVLGFIDSITQALPDSQRVAIQTNNIKVMDEAFDNLNNMKKKSRSYSFIDRRNQKFATIRTFDYLQGKVDSTKVISSEYTNDFMNPFELLYQMNSELIKMILVGKVTENNSQFWLIQVQQDEKWVDVYFDIQTKLIHKIVIPEIIEKPFFGKGPILRKQTHIFQKYKSIGGLFLPQEIELLSTDEHNFTDIIALTWLYLDSPIPDNIFKPIATLSIAEIYTFSRIGEKITLLEKKSNMLNSRMVIVEEDQKKLSLVTEISNNPEFNIELKDVILEHFPQHSISEIFTLSPLSGYSSLSCFIKDSTIIYFPKELDANSKSFGNHKEDSLYKEFSKMGLLHAFDIDQLQGNIQTYVFNPNESRAFYSLRIGYYFPDERLFYLFGILDQKSDTGITPIERHLWELIINRKLVIEKIVYSNSRVNHHPTFTSFEELKTKIIKSR